MRRHLVKEEIVNSPKNLSNWNDTYCFPIESLFGHSYPRFLKYSLLPILLYDSCDVAGQLLQLCAWQYSSFYPGSPNLYFVSSRLQMSQCSG